jgi:hypothetical protein
VAGFRFDTFKGIRPRVRAKLLPPNESQTASNARLGSGAVEPWNDVQLDQAASQQDITSIYRMRNNGSPIWLEAVNDVDFAPGPVPDDTLERTYYTGEAQPRMTYIGIVEDTPTPTPPLPDDYRYLGIPAPTTAATTVGDALPSAQITGTVSDFHTAYLRADFAINQNLPNGVAVNSWYMALTVGGVESDNGYEPGGTTRTYDFDMAIGREMRVTAVPDPNTITVEDANAGNYLAKGVDDTSVAHNWWRNDDAVVATRAGHFRFYLPNDMDLTATAHGLQVDDVIRVTAVPEPVGVTMTQPGGSITAFGGILFGWESDNPAGDPDTNTWPASRVDVGADDFWQAGVGTAPGGYPFVQAWNTRDGASGADFTTINGSFDWLLVERDGETYTDIVTDIESRIYVYTFVSELGEEGPPSPPSTVVTIPTDGDVTVSAFDTPPSTQRNITNMRIYRANTGTESTEFQFVAEIASPFNPYVDSITDTDLGEILQTESWEPPPAGLQGIIALPNGMMAGFVDKTVWFSEPYFPHAWPPEYKQAVEHDIVGLGALPNGVAVLTKGTPYALVGDHPRGMSLQKFQFAQACVSKRSIVNTLDSVLYASPDGLCEIGARGFSIVTRGHATKREWQTYNPTTMQGFWHDDKYFGFHSGGTIIFDPKDESIGFTTTDDTLIAGFVDVETDTLYVMLTAALTDLLVVAGVGAIETSEDGTTWTDRTVASGTYGSTGWSEDWAGGWIGNNLSGTPDMITSTDGVTWSTQTQPLGTFVFGFAYSPTLKTLVAVGSNGGGDFAASTTDGTTWAGPHSWSPHSATGSAVAWSSDRAEFLAISDAGWVSTSTDGTTWTTPVNKSLGTPSAGEAKVVWCSGTIQKYVYSNGTNVFYSSDGSTWVQETSLNFTDAREVAYSPTLDRVVVVTNGGAGSASRFNSSTDGINWTADQDTPAAQMQGVEWSADLGLFFASGRTGEIVTSTNGTSWTEQTEAVSDDFRTAGIVKTGAPLEISEWDGSATARTFTWKSGKLRSPYPMNLGAARIEAPSYPVTLDIWAGGAQVVTARSVTDDEVIRLPDGYLEDEFEIQIQGDDAVDMVHVAETVEELLRG